MAFKFNLQIFVLIILLLSNVSFGTNISAIINGSLDNTTIISNSSNICIDENTSINVLNNLNNPTNSKIKINESLANISTKNNTTTSSITNLKNKIKNNISNKTKLNNTKIITGNITSSNKTINETDYLDVIIEDYKVIVKTNGKVFGFANKTPLKFIKVADNEYVISPIILNTQMEIYAKFKDGKVLNKTVILDYKKVKEKKENEKNKKKMHYLNVSFHDYKLVIKTNGKPHAKYLDINVKVKIKKIKKHEYLVYPVILNKTIVVYAKFKNETLNKTIFLKYPEKNITTNKTIVLNDVYFPSKKIIIKTNFKPHTAYIITPTNKIIKLKVHKKGNYYILSTKLKRSVILGNYSVVVDGIKKTFAVDSYKINAKLKDGRFIVGNVSYHVKEPKFITCIVNKKKINISLINGTFVIPIDYLVMKFNISKSKKIKVILICGNSKKKLKLKLKNEQKVKKLISYDPVNKEIVIKIEGSEKEIKKLLKKYKKHKYKISKILELNNYSILEIKIKANKEILKEYNLSEDILKTNETVKKISNNKIRVEVKNKIDGVWYKFSCKIPKGYRVKEIVGDDGRVIKNNISINRLTGEAVGEMRWYIENNTLYFYDDPIFGYDISLIPPAPNHSIAVELSYNGQDSGGCGQISAIVFPYNEGDDNSIIATHDHAGRNGDYNYANNIDAYAGSKIAIKYTSGALTRQYGVLGTASISWSWGGFTYYYLSEINRENISGNSVPNGVLESLIITDMYAPWDDNELNITQKVIIRGNNKWFATIYYIKNPTTKTYTNLKFFQGMDWNFGGSYEGDDAYYNSIDDVVYGYDSNASVGDIQYGGFKSNIPSYEHDVNLYWNMWNDIRNDNLNNGSSYNGDAGTALAWTKSSLKPGEIWVIPIIWGLGFNYSDMMNEINMGLNQLYDAGVKSIDYPDNDDSFNPNIYPIIDINSTIALYGLVDAYNLNVSIKITQINGTYTYENSTLINLSVPYEEKKEVIFPINISDMPYGTYNVTIKTNLPNDQNTSNDEKSIIIHIVSFSVYPKYQEKTENPGKEVFYNITLYNFDNERVINIDITNSTKNWITKVYNYSTLIAEDYNGDGVWDYINPNYDLNNDNLPDIIIPQNSNLNLTVSKVIPSTSPLGEIDLTTLKFVDKDDTSTFAYANFQTSTPYPPSVQKTFYLHGNELKTLNTSIPTESNNYTTILGNSFASWVQYPKFAEDFTVLGNISILLYLEDPNVVSGGWSSYETHKVVVTLIATNGDSSFVIGSDGKTLNLDNTITPYIFNINLNSIVTIPKGYYLVLKVENQQSSNSINVYHDSTYISNITLNTTTYVKVYDISSDKTVYGKNETATIFANITDPIGSYDIKGANITVYYPNGSVYINTSMNLQEVDYNTPSLWKLYNYSFTIPETGEYNITIIGIESNGVISEKSYTIYCGYNIHGYVKEDFKEIGKEDSQDKGIYGVNVSIFEDSNDNRILDVGDKIINSTTTNIFGYYSFLVYNTSKTYFVAVNSKTVGTTRGLNPGYSINDIWAEETYQTVYTPLNNSQWIINGNSSIYPDKIILTPDENNQVGSVWYYGPVDLSEDLVVEFYEYLGDNPDGADGITFTLQPLGTNELGGSGGELGYSGISPSVAVEVDTWINDFDSPATTDHIAIDVNGNVNHTYNKNTYSTPDPYDLGNVEDGKEHLIKIVWNATTKTLQVYFDGNLALTWNKDITQIIGNSTYFGFTGGTGGAKNLQYIKPTYIKNGDNYVINPTYRVVEMFGGKDYNKEDNWDIGNFEHYCLIDLGSYRGENITFGFSFDVITNTKTVGQGSFSQFIKNANAIYGKDEGYFKIPNIDAKDGNYYIYTSGNKILDNLTIVNGSTQLNGTVVLSGLQWLTNGDSYLNNSDNLTLILTPYESNQVGSVWYYEPVDLSEDLVVEFYAYLGDNPDGADGITFTLQSLGTNELGGAGGGLGYSGISPSVAVEVDTWINDFDSPATTDHIAIDVNGNVNHTYNKNTYSTPDPYDLGNVEDGKEHLIKIVWNATTKTLQVYFDGNLALTWNKDITQIIGNSTYFGFTGGTGGAKNLQYIKPTYIKNGADVLDIGRISQSPIIDNVGYNVNIENITFENVSVGILANETGLNNLTLKSCKIYGRILNSGIKLADYDWNLQESPTYISNLIINASGSYGLLVLNKVWAEICNSHISLNNGDGIYWANWAGGSGNLTLNNTIIESCSHGIIAYKDGVGLRLVNSKVVNSVYEGIILMDNSSLTMYNSSILKNSIGIYSNRSSVLIDLSNILNNGYEGLLLENSSSVIVNSNISNNSIGIYLNKVNSSIIQKSNISYNYYGVEIINSSNVVINSSNIFNISMDGIAIFNGENITIESSSLYKNNYSVLSYGNLSNFYILNSTFNSSINDTLDIEVPYNHSLTNFKLYNSNILNSGSYGIHIYSIGNSSSVTIFNSLINGSFKGGIYIYGVDEINITNNTLTHNGLIGGDPAGSGITISGYNSEDVIIEGNNISYNLGNGVSLEGLWGNILKDVVVKNNFISNNGIDENDGNGIYIGGKVENVYVFNNTVQYSDAQAILIQESNGWNSWDWIGTNITIDNNTLQHNGVTISSGNITAGITVGAYGNYNQDSGYIIIKNNEIVNNNLCPNTNYTGKMGGIEVYGLNESWINLEFNISGNIIANNSAYGILIAASKDINIINNTIYNNEKGITIPSWDFVPYNIIISKNSIYNNSLLGIDLNDDNVTLNDGLLNSNEPNYGIDYPIITYADISGDNLTVKGYIGKTSSSSNFANAVVEIYLVKNLTSGDNLVGNNISSSGDALNNSYGEGWIYLGSLMAGENGFFSGTLNVSGKGVGNDVLLTATATISGKGTSEFGRNYLLIKKFFNITGTITMFPNGYNITVKSYNTTKDVYVYWYKPDNIEVINISGDYDENGTNGNTYWFKFNSIEKDMVKHITIKTNITIVDGLVIGIDPKK